MRTRWVWAVSSFALVVLFTLAAGCGSGESAGPPADADAALMAAAARQYSDLLTAAYAGAPPSSADWQSVEAAFAAARATSPRDGEPNFGWALMHLGAVSALVTENLSLDLVGQPYSGARAVDSNNLPTLLTAGGWLVSPLGAVFALGEVAPMAGAHALMPLLPGQVGPDLEAGDPTWIGRRSAPVSWLARAGTRQDWPEPVELDVEAAVAALRTQVLPALAEARQAMAQVLNDSEFSFEVPSLDFDGDPHTATYGLPEARLVAGLIDLIDGTAQLALAYDCTPPPDGVLVTAEEMADGQLTPDDYLPPPPFGLLAADGAARSAQAIGLLQSATGQVQTAWQEVQQQGTVAGIGLTDLMLLAADAGIDAGVVSSALAEARALVSGPHTLSYEFLALLYGVEGNMLYGRQFGHDTVEVNVPAFIGHPPRDVRTVVPTFGLVRDNEFAADWRECDFFLGNLDGQTAGDLPDQDGLVSLGGLLEPPLSEAEVLQQWIGSGLAIRPDQSGGYAVWLLSWPLQTEDLLPWSGERTYTVPIATMDDNWRPTAPVVYEVVISDDGDPTRAASFREITIRLSSSDGLFDDTRVIIDQAMQHRIDGRAAGSDSLEHEVHVFVDTYEESDVPPPPGQPASGTHVGLWIDYGEPGWSYNRFLLGVARDATTGLPIEGAAVHLATDGPEPVWWLAEPTDAEGTFVIGPFYSETPLSLVCEAPGYATYANAAPDTERFDIELSPAARRPR